MMDKPNGNGPKATENGVKGKPPRYSVETPYGFRLDLDFLKYVDDIEKGHTIKRVPIQRRSKGQRPSTLPRHLNISGQHGYRQSPWGSTGALAQRKQFYDPHHGYGSWACDGKSPASPDGCQSVAEMEASIRAFDEQPLGEHVRPSLWRASSLPLTVLLTKGSESTEDPTGLKSSRGPLGRNNMPMETPAYSHDRSSDRCLSSPDSSGTLRRLTEALERVAQLEEDVRVIPELRAQICILQEEKERLRLGLNPRHGSRANVPLYSTSELKSPREERSLFPRNDGDIVTDDGSYRTHEWRTSTDLDELLTVTSLQAKVALLEQRLHLTSLELQRATTLLTEQQEEARRRGSQSTEGWWRAERVPVEHDEEGQESSSRLALVGAHGASIRERLNVGEAFSTDPVTFETNPYNSGTQVDGGYHHICVPANPQENHLRPGEYSSETVQVRHDVREPGLAVEQTSDQEASPGGMNGAEAALHVRRIQILVEQQWECLCGGRDPGGDRALEHPDSRVNKLQQEIRSLVHTLSSYYNHEASDGAEPEGAPQSIMKCDSRARTSRTLHFAGVNSGFETTPDVDPESRSITDEDDSATQTQAEGPVPSEHTMETERAQGDPGPIPGMMEGTGVMGGTRKGPEPEEETVGEQEAELAEWQLDSSTEQPMEAEPQPNTDSETVDGEFIAACHFLKDHMDNMDNPNDEMVWFQVAAEEDSVATQVALFLREVRTATPSLLPFLVNMADDNGNTALHYSVSHTNYPIVRLLLDTGVCEVDLQNKAGYTAVMLASLTAPGDPGDMDVVRRLMELGDVNARASQGGQTALMLAVRHGRALMARLLLRCRADPNVQDHQGATALMYACQRGHAHIVRLLLERAECDTSLTDRRGRTALSMAQQGSHADITSLLQAQHTYAGTSL